MAENNTEGSPHSEEAVGATVKQPRPSLLRRIFGGKAQEQPTATITSPTSKPKGAVPRWVEKAREGTLPAKDYTVRLDPKKPKEVLGEL